MTIRSRLAKLDPAGSGSFDIQPGYLVAHAGTIGAYSITFRGGQIDTGGTQLTKYTRGNELFMPGGSANISGSPNDGVTAWFDF